MDPYKNFIGFYTRSQDAFVNYNLVLDVAISCEVQEYEVLTEEECVSVLSPCVDQWYGTLFACHENSR
jgi:hypothetical protein